MLNSLEPGAVVGSLRVLEVVNVLELSTGLGRVFLCVRDCVKRGKSGAEGVLDIEDRTGRRIRAIADIVEGVN